MARRFALIARSNLASAGRIQIMSVLIAVRAPGNHRGCDWTVPAIYRPRLEPVGGNANRSLPHWNSAKMLRALTSSGRASNHIQTTLKECAANAISRHGY